MQFIASAALPVFGAEGLSFFKTSTLGRNGATRELSLFCKLRDFELLEELGLVPDYATLVKVYGAAEDDESPLQPQQDQGININPEVGKS